MIGLYDTPDASLFEPLVRPAEGRWACVSYQPPFASGCGLFGSSFEELNRPEAIIGATNLAMRKFLPADLLAFTVTMPMFEQLCALDEKSFLNKPFWMDVRKKKGMDTQH